MYDFANILFSGPCNARCSFCIGRQIHPDLNQPNLDRYPPLNLEAFVELVSQHAVRQVVFTGSNTDPQRYQHEEKLLSYLRQRLPPETQYSLHTNGLLALKKMTVFNQYDRVTISLPTFNRITYAKMMGRRLLPNLGEILIQATPAIKISCVVTQDNKVELPAFLEGCASLGVRRVVLRKLYGDTRPWSSVLPWRQLSFIQAGSYRGNPMFKMNAMEITLWDFHTTQSTSINLFANGTLSTQYLLSETGQNEKQSWDLSNVTRSKHHSFHSQLSS